MFKGTNDSSSLDLNLQHFSYQLQFCLTSSPFSPGEPDSPLYPRGPCVLEFKTELLTGNISQIKTLIGQDTEINCLYLLKLNSLDQSVTRVICVWCNMVT